jgi:iron complex outermembrane receptor protein
MNTKDAKQREASMHRISGRIRFSSTPVIFFFALWCAGADAQTLVHFDLPAQSLARSLNEIGTATNTDVGFSATQVAGLLAPPLKADLTVDGALARVLVGTGLQPKHLDDHTIVIATAEAMERSVPTSPRADLLHIAKVADNSTQQMPAQTDAPVPRDVTNSLGNVSPSPRDDLEEVVVTGTHIRGIDNKTNPIIVIDRDQIDRSGYSSTQDLFRSLPQNFTSGDASADGIYGGNANAARNADYGSGINLRGLGPSSTLVLLDGHRLAPSALGSFVDVSLIPLSAIDRVEIMTDGSSAIYGSDAVGGVVNIVLKKDYRGADTTARFGSVTDGSHHEELLAQTLGTAWSTGSIVGTLQYQQQSALPAIDRDFTSALPSPNDLLPKTRSYGATLNGRQTLGGGLEFYGDVLLSKRDFIRGNSGFEGSPALDIVFGTHTDGIAETVDVTPGLRYQFSDRWSVELNGLYGRQKTTDVQVFGVPSTPLINESTNSQFTEKSADLIVNGRVAAMPAGDIGLAAGTSYRTEDLDAIGVQTPGDIVNTQGEHRHIAAAFGELYVPIVGRENHIPLVEALELSAAVRRDHYSDFGSTTNPRIGLHWAPWTGFSLKASYGKSFRAPSTAEEFSESPLFQTIASFPPILLSPRGGLTSALLEGGSKVLTAERARTEDFSIEYKPSGIEGFVLNVGYYDIRYTDRIVSPNFNKSALIEPNVYGSLVTPVPSDAAAQAIIDAAVAAGSQYNNFSGTGATGIRYLLDLRQQNASMVNQTGFDVTSRYTRPIGSHTLIAQLNISFIDKIDTQLSPGAAFDNLVNTVANPAKWRGRLDLSWASNRWSVGGALNAVGSYVNAETVGNPSVASWTTVDLNATINPDAYFQAVGWKGVSLSLIALNVLNRDPPFVDAASLFRVNYDPSNASPLGRFLALTVKKKW